MPVYLSGSAIQITRIAIRPNIVTRFVIMISNFWIILCAASLAESAISGGSMRGVLWTLKYSSVFIAENFLNVYLLIF